MSNLSTNISFSCALTFSYSYQIKLLAVNTKYAYDIRNSLQHCLSFVSSISKRESDPQVVYGYNSLAYDYAAGYYTPSLAYHDFRYPYVAGYGPRAFTFGYRKPMKM